MPVTVLQPGFVNGGPKRGSETTERGRVCEGGGSLFPFPPFLFFPVFFLLADQQGAWPPCAPLATPVSEEAILSHSNTMSYSFRQLQAIIHHEVILH